MIPQNQEHIEAIKQASTQQIIDMTDKLTEKGQRQAKAILQAEEILSEAKVSFCSTYFTDGFKDGGEKKANLSWFHHGFDDTDGYDEKGNVKEEYRRKIEDIQLRFLEVFYQQTLRSNGCPEDMIFTPVGFSLFLKLIAEALDSHESTPYDLSDDEY